MTCKICGDENTATYRPSKRQTLCSGCNAGTPAKLSRPEFERRYWRAGDVSTVPECTRREFYSDYLCSNLSYAAYESSTSEPA